MTTLVRRRLYRDREVGELARDVDGVFADYVRARIFTLDGLYQEPLWLSHPRQPAGVLLIRAQNLDTPTATVAAYAPADFTYQTPNRVRVNNVEGLTVGTRYRLTFMVVG